MVFGACATRFINVCSTVQCGVYIVTGAVQEESGSEWNFVSCVRIGRGYPVRDSTTWPRLLCHDTKERARASNGTQAHGTRRHSTPWCGCTSPRTRGTAETPPLQEQGGERRTCSYHFRAVVELWIPLASQLSHRSSTHTDNQWRASTGHRRKYHKVNKTVTAITLQSNSIGDAGATALAESLKATLVMRFRLVRSTLLLGPARTHRRRSVICVTSVLWVLHVLICFKCVSVARCRAVTSCARALASVLAAETLDLSASAAGVNAEQSLARAKHPIKRFVT